MGSICVKFNEDRVHALYPEASMIPAMKMWNLPKNKRDRLEEYCDNGDYLASVKKDGYFYSLNRTPSHVYLFSRSAGVNGLLTEKIGHIPHIAETALKLPADTLLAGEIYIPGKESKDVTKIMGCLAPKAITRQEKEGKLYYYIFDVIMYDGEDYRKKPYEERIKTAQMIYDTYLKDNPHIQIAEQIDTDIYAHVLAWLDAGEEGAVLRKKDSTYDPDMRPAWSSIKVKQEETIDVVITGFEDPTMLYTGNSGEHWEYWIDGPADDPKYPNMRIPVTKAYYFGWKNAVVVSAYDKDGNLKELGTIASGLTDELRAEFASNPEKYLNRVIEVNCMSTNSKDYTIRHGFFVRFRDDKNPEDCTIKEIFT